MPMNLILHKTFTTKSKYVHCLCSSFHLILYQHCYVFCIRLLHLTEARRWRPKLSCLTGKYPQFYEVPESVSPKQQSDNCRYNLNFAYKLIYVCSSRAKSRLCFTILLKWNFQFQGKTSKEKICRLYLPLRLFCQISGYQSLKAKLFKIQYHTVWPLAVKLPVNICSVQYFKLALMTQHSLEERKKNAEMSVGHSYLFMIHRSRAKAEYLMKLFHPKRVKSGPVAAGCGRFRLSRAQSSRQDLKRKVWLFEWID